MIGDYWQHLSASPFDVDRIVAGLHNVERLETMSRYTHRDGLYFPRVAAAMEQLPREHRDAALAVFGSVIYIPDAFLSATMKYLWWSLRSTAASKGDPISADAADLYLIEVDQDGLVPNFARQNALSARLNAAVHPKLGDVQHLRAALSNLINGTERERVHARAQLHLVAEKRAWLVLTDKALSGQSLLGDLQRIVFARDLLATGSLLPMIYVGAQIITSAAEDAVDRWIVTEGVKNLRILSAIRLDERARVGADECALFDSPTTHGKVLELCSWFDQEVVSRDLSLGTFRERSGGSLALGYKQTGLTLVDYGNTPTNSLPLLWFDSADPSAIYAGEPPVYIGPYPRVHSRRGTEDSRWSEGSLWQDLMCDDARTRMLQELAR